MQQFQFSRRTLLGSGLALAATSVPLPLLAQGSYPNKPVKFIVPFNPGADTDILTREIASKLNQSFGYSIVVENKPGAGGSLGTDAALREPADGYTGVVVSGTYITNNLVSKPEFDAIGGVQPIIQISRIPGVIVVGATSPAKSLADFVAMAKKSPGYVTYGTSGIGSMGNLAGEFFSSLAGIKLNHIPYKGAAGAVVNDLVSGQVDMTMAGVAGMRSLAKAGKLRILAVGDTKRLPDFPDVPTYAEAGFAKFDFELWHGLLMPKGVPNSVVEKLNADINAVLRSPDVRQNFDLHTAVPVGGTAEQFRRVMSRDLEKWKRVITAANIKIK